MKLEILVLGGRVMVIKTKILHKQEHAHARTHTHIYIYTHTYYLLSKLCSMTIIIMHL